MKWFNPKSITYLTFNKGTLKIKSSSLDFQKKARQLKQSVRGLNRLRRRLADKALSEPDTRRQKALRASVIVSSGGEIRR